MYATIDIFPGMMIAPFRGKILRKKRYHSDTAYSIRLDAKTWAKPSGIQQTANHSCSPNAVVRKWTQGKGKTNFSIVALTMIPMGVEITIDFSQDETKARQK